MNQPDHDFPEDLTPFGAQIFDRIAHYLLD